MDEFFLVTSSRAGVSSKSFVNDEGRLVLCIKYSNPAVGIRFRFAGEVEPYQDAFGPTSTPLSQLEVTRNLETISNLSKTPTRTRIAITQTLAMVKYTDDVFELIFCPEGTDSYEVETLIPVTPIELESLFASIKRCFVEATFPDRKFEWSVRVDMSGAPKASFVPQDTTEYLY